MRQIDTVLVANRGEIARRVARTAREMGIRVVTVFVDADADALHVDDADTAIRVGSYLDGDAIVEAALRMGADAVHPGYGYLSENSSFAAACEGAGLIWIGPTPAAIDAMGDKIEAKRHAVAADVPVLLSADDPDEFASVGFPLLIKAAAGGGGKGMRVVESAEELGEAIDAARREALTGFGDDRVFAERYVRRARHIEIQIVGDVHGSVVHLGERECSIQRRHQKIIEEAPSPFLGAERREAMGAAAVSLASAIGYVSTGTVEFLVDDESGEFFFLEVNTRLQVEHPVTEEITGIDLVRAQLRVAQGHPLDWAQGDIGFTGHSVEARIYAEDPSAGFLPATGTLHAFEAAAMPEVRLDSGVGPGSSIGTDFDPMIAKVISRAPTRAEAISSLALALERMHIGGVVTNRDFLAATLRTAEFAAGDTTTDFIERVDISSPPAEAETRFWGVAAAMWLQAMNRARAGVLASMPSGFRTGRLPAESVVFALEAGGGDNLEVHYRRLRDGGFVLGRDADQGTVVVHRVTPDSIDVEWGDIRSTARVTRAGDTLYLTGPKGTVGLSIVPRFVPPEAEVPVGAVAAPMPGRVVEVRVTQGEAVLAGDVVVVLEAMKMEHHLRAAEDGVATEVRVAAGDQVENGALLLVIDSTE
ncbi:MAG: biotin/lipoyl-binding protein [Actinomycetia bacterium]|nr:biotin/lipoyl-binding protein [Actinomycetes bacterium]